MSEILVPGAPTNIPAGYASQSLTGGFPSLTLASNIGGADIIEFTGVLTAQNITVTVPLAPFPSQVAGNVSFSGPTTSGWLKVFKNSTSGAFEVIVAGASAGATLVIPQGETLWAYSADGINVFAASGAAGSGAPLAVYFAAANGITTTSLATPPVNILGAAIPAIPPTIFQGTRILVEASFAGSSSGGVAALLVDLAVDAVPVAAPVAQVTPSAAGINVGATVSWLIPNVPGTAHAISLQLASGTGGTAVTIDPTAAGGHQYATITVSDLP